MSVFTRQRLAGNLTVNAADQFMQEKGHASHRAENQFTCHFAGVPECMAHLAGLVLMLLAPILGAVAAGISLGALYDFASFAIVALFAAGGAIMAGGIRPAWSAFLFCLTGNRDVRYGRRQLRLIVDAAARLALAGGVMGSLIGIAGIFSALAPVNDPRALGRALGASLLTLLYGLLFYGGLVACSARLRQKLP